MSKPNTACYTAGIALDQSTRNLECVVYRMVTGGVCGPESVFTVEDTEVNALDLALAQRGYTRTGTWVMDTSYQGMTLEATVTPV